MLGCMLQVCAGSACHLLLPSLRGLEEVKELNLHFEAHASQYTSGVLLTFLSCLL